MADEASEAMECIRAAEVIAALSRATDLGIGVPLEYGLHSTLLAMRLADRLNVDAATATQTYYACQLFYVGCTAKRRRRRGPVRRRRRAHDVRHSEQVRVAGRNDSRLSSVRWRHQAARRSRVPGSSPAAFQGSPGSSSIKSLVREEMCAHPAKAALNQAEREGLIVINAARLVEMEPGRRPTVQPLEPAEFGRLLDYTASDELGPLFETIASTGLRRGEALALRWSDADLDVGVVHVRRQLVQLAAQHPCESYDGHAGVMVSTPKTPSGVRTIELDAHTLGTLLDQQLRQDADRERLGTAYIAHNLVFAQENGNPLDTSMVTKRFGVLCEEAGVRKIRLHDLRHVRLRCDSRQESISASCPPPAPPADHS